MENSLLEINPGILEAVEAMGDNPGRSSGYFPWVPGNPGFHGTLHLQYGTIDFSERPRWLVMSAEAESVTWR